MSDAPRFDVSVILPFGDDEEAVGIAVRRTAEYLRGLKLSFEILAIDEDSGDNSHAVLALLRGEVPELRVTHAPGRGKGVDVGSSRAQGTLLLVSTPDVASASLDGAGDACRRLIAERRRRRSRARSLHRRASRSRALRISRRQASRSCDAPPPRRSGSRSATSRCASSGPTGAVATRPGRRACAHSLASFERRRASRRVALL